MVMRTLPVLELSLVAQSTSAAQGLFMYSVTVLDVPLPISGPTNVPARMVALCGGVYTVGSEGYISQAETSGICPCLTRHQIPDGGAGLIAAAVGVLCAGVELTMTV